MREAVRTGEQEWASYAPIREYSNVCFWAIRKLEYGFAAEAIAAAQADAAQPLRVLDVGCGVVPFCNWVSRAGHAVTAIDPIAADIEFLLRSDLNQFYGSRVSYEAGSAERLRFSDKTFDVVTCLSVLEHIPPGNDRVALWEVARVLKPDGLLIITLDVAPVADAQPGEQPWPRELRRYAQPFSHASLRHLFDEAGRGFDVVADDVPEALATLDWETVHDFWGSSQAHDERTEPLRDYLAFGSVLRRNAFSLRITRDDIETAYLEGQAALGDRLSFYQWHAAERLRTMEMLQAENRAIRAAIEAREAELPQSR